MSDDNGSGGSAAGDAVAVPTERVDAVVVGARCAGSATAATLAGAGRSVIVIDRARFPSDTLSTHAMFPSGVAEFQRIGAWPRIRDELRPAELQRVRLTLADGTEAIERWEPVDGIDHGVSIPRNLLDIKLVENARERGADVRERCSLREVLWEHGRVTGVTYRDPEGDERRVLADVVVGADGRRSAVAAGVGAWRPYRGSKNGRGLVFRYMDDPNRGSVDSRTMWQWRDENSLAFAFPTPDDRIICLFMGPASEVADARRDPDGYWARKLAQHPGCAARVTGATGMTKLRSTADVEAFWRASSGPGWVLAGDASHFKDPVTGQGMGDALRMGRTLGEALAPVLGEPAAMDRAARRWEHDTLRHCLHAYHFANFETEADDVSPVFRELIRHLGRDGEPALSHIFGRTRHTKEVVTWSRMVRALAAALVRGPRRLESLRFGLRFALMQARIRRELARDRFREPGPVPGSDHPGFEFWEPPTASPGAAPERRAEAAVPVAR
ncbi:MAG TPA: FAD-dependent monooxygenase [Solirubrobacterales bacterium]|nr:FAD-dependent monooxygenase [Solirubrobacterales bacterium]